MDEMKFETALSTSSKNGHICEAEEGHVDEESWEEEINPLGLLDLVYVEENKEDENCNNTTVPSTSSTSDLVSHLNLETLDSDADDDEGEELEPVAAVDVSPVREEDFLPEGMNEDVLSSTRSTYLTSSALLLVLATSVLQKCGYQMDSEKQGTGIFGMLHSKI